MTGRPEPTALEMMRALLTVLCDERVKSDALFIHGEAMGDRKLLNETLVAAAGFYHGGLTNKILLNGLSEEACRKMKLCYSGHEQLLRGLAHLDVPAINISLIPPAEHTAKESGEVLKLARERGWRTVTIASQPHHQLRCFLQIIELMGKMKFWINVYNLTSCYLPQTRRMAKPLLGGGVLEGTIQDHIAGEYERILKYAQKDGDGFTPHATIPEALAYLDRRNRGLI